MARTVERDETRLWVHCGVCQHKWQLGVVLPAPMRDAARAMQDTVCPSCGADMVLFGVPPVAVQPSDQIGSVEARIRAWIESADYGQSSRAIATVMTGHRADWGSWPRDPSDLGRCVRLLQRIPEWRDRIGEMAAVSGPWAALVERWDELNGLLDMECGTSRWSGRPAPRTNAVMRHAIGAGLERDARVTVLARDTDGVPVTWRRDIMEGEANG